MSANQIPTLLRLVSASVCVARRAGVIVKNVINKGNLGIVLKVTGQSFPQCESLTFYLTYRARMITKPKPIEGPRDVLFHHYPKHSQKST